MSNPRTPSWKAVLAVVVAGGGLLWHILACTESPMAFSPSGKDLAFVVMDPYTDKDLHLAGAHVYRLMVLSGGEKVRIVEETQRHMLTAPAYSPDGKYLAYFRIPLLTAEAAEKLSAEVQTRKEALGKPLPWPAAQAATGPAAGPVTAAAAPAADPAASKTEDLGLPPLEKAASFYKGALVGPLTPVELVVRDAMATDVIIATIPMDLPVFADRGGDAAPLFAYLLTRPQYSPDGKWVYFCLGDLAAAIDPRTGDKRLLAAPANVAVLSPDAKTLVAASDHTLSFLRTDGTRATSIRWDKDLSASGIVWTDADTLALVSIENKAVRIELLKADGTVTQGMDLPAPGEIKDHSTGELAVAAGRKHMVLCYGNETHFLDGSGKLILRRRDEEQLLAQPTFTPDGAKVACKLLAKGPDGQVGVREIIFFSPEGKELSRAKLPAPPATQPAKP